MGRKTYCRYCHVTKQQIHKVARTATGRDVCKCHNQDACYFCLGCDGMINCVAWASHQKKHETHKRRLLVDARQQSVDEVISISSDEDSLDFATTARQNRTKKHSFNSKEQPESLDTSDDEVFETTPKKQKKSHEYAPVKADPDSSPTTAHQQSTSAHLQGTSTPIPAPSTSQTPFNTVQKTSIQLSTTPTKSHDTATQGDISEKVLILMNGLKKNFINEDEYAKLFTIVIDPTNRWQIALCHGLLLMEQLLETEQGKQRWELTGAKLVQSIIE